MGRISFNYLPANPLAHGWRLAEPNKPSLTSSVPPDLPDGLSIQAEEAIDCNVENHQKVCNRVEFSAKLSARSYVYAKVHLVSKDGHTVARDGWIACDVGNGPPRKVSRDEWVIMRYPRSDGWAEFDLLLPDEVSRTFGHAEGLEFSQLLGFRLRGSLSISPIKLFSYDLSDTTTHPGNTSSHKKIPWNRADKMSVVMMVIGVLAIIVALTVPESRTFLGLEKAQRAQQTESPSISAPPGRDSSRLLPARFAKNIRELREENHLARLADSESEKFFPEIPSNSYGFVNGLSLVSSTLNELRIETNRTLHTFEIQKLADGNALVVGYVGPETFDRLREGLLAGADFDTLLRQLERRSKLGCGSRH